MKAQRTRTIFSILAILTMVVLFAIIFAACDTTEQGKQVPVYKGITISKNFASTSATTASGAYYKAQSNDEIDPKPGCVEGDHEHRDDDFDENKPFEDENAPSIEQKAESTLDVVGAGTDIYYADKNQDIFITVKLSNPDSYEILSFTLNGKKYSNYMFEAGSDMENLVLKVNVGNEGGIHDYTIDAIKYVDGTEIKDVRMDGDKTVKAGVRANDQTYASVTNEKKSMTSISFDVQIVDNYSLINMSEGYAKAVLYDGINMTTKDITVGEKNSVVFDNLTPNMAYQYGVVAFYDNLSGDGAQLNVLYKKAVYTDTIVLFKDVQVGQETLTWYYQWNENIQDKTMTALTLWQGDDKAKDLDASVTSLEGLKTNNTYTLKATYKNLNNEEESIEIDFTTQTKQVPSVWLTTSDITQTSAEFAIDVTDNDNVGAITKIELLHGKDEPVVAEDLTIREFTGLLSNNEYTVRVTYTYDLKDGVGAQYIVKTAVFRTAAKAVPNIAVTTSDITQTSAGFTIDVTDNDNVGAITKIELLHGEDTTVVAEDLTIREFTGLLSNNEYTARVTYTYDLNDGVGAQYIVKTAVFRTAAKAVPSVEIENLTNTTSTIGFGIDYTDVDNVGNVTAVELYKGNALIATSTEKESVSFDGLDNDTEYNVVVTCKYDLNDGKGEQNLVVNAKRYTSPVFEFVEATCANTSAVSKGDVIYFEAVINNPSGVSVDKIKINDTYYTPSSGTTKNSIIVNITVEDQFEGGNTELKVSEIVGTLRGQEVKLVPTENSVASVFVNGELSVKSITVVDEDGKEVEHVVKDKQYYYLVKLNNKTGYKIDEIVTTETWNYTIAHSDDVVLIDKNTLKVPVKFGFGAAYPCSVMRITYSNEYLGSKSKDINDVEHVVVCFDNETQQCGATQRHG